MRPLVAVLSAERFLDLLKERAEVTFRMLTRLTTMVRSGDVRIMELSTLAATQRVYVERGQFAEAFAGTQVCLIPPGPGLIRPSRVNYACLRG